MKATGQNNIRALLFLLVLLLAGLQFRRFVIHSQHTVDDVHPLAIAGDTPRTIHQSKVCSVPHPICRSIFSADNRHATASFIWKKRFKDILKASIPNQDTHQIHARWTEALIQLLTPTVLQKGIRSTPTNLKSSLHAIFEKLQQRFISNPSDTTKLKILVLGGSTAEGTGCHNVPPDVKGLVVNITKGTTGKSRTCSWPSRLQHLIEAIVPGSSDWIEIINLSVGGTHSGLAGPFLEYWLYPPAFRPEGPDIVINAYSANDHVPPAYHYSQPYNTTTDYYHASEILQRNQQFVQHAKNSYCGSNPHLPLIVYVDDYWGDQQPSLVGDTQGSEFLSSSFREDIVFLSPAHAVRPFVYARTGERLFSPRWNLEPNAKANHHYGLSGHLTVTLVVAYAFLQLVLDVCQDGNIDTPVHQKQYVTMTMHPQTRGYHDRCNAGGDAPCVFGFLAAPLGTHNNAKDLNNYLGQFTSHNDGWQAKDQLRDGGHQNKLGLVATKPNATLVLAIHHVPQYVRKLTLHTLKSYSESFQGSWISCTLEIFFQRQLVESKVFSIYGHHKQSNSIAVPWTFTIQNAKPQSSIRFRIQLMGGKNFQINALLFCNH